MSIKQYVTEAELCAAFIKHNSEKWTAYPETAGFDILMVRKSDGFQIGVEAKLALNAKVILQASEPAGHWWANEEGPDCRAVLVPWKARGSDLAVLLGRLCVTAIYFGEDHEEAYGTSWNSVHHQPPLPTSGEWHFMQGWTEVCPARRCKLPEHIPDVVAGSPAPVQLTDWKIKAIKIAVLLEKRGYLTRADFKYHQIDMTRWTQGSWLFPDHSNRGRWIRGSRMPDFKAQHPVNYPDIEADFENWNQEVAA